MTDDKRDGSAGSEDVKASFAWGRLFAGSLIGGLAVWKLLHKMTNTEPSEWIRGLAVTYGEWRDWLMTPLNLINLELLEFSRDIIVVIVVLLGAVLGVAARHPRLSSYVLFLIVLAALLFSLYNWISGGHGVLLLIGGATYKLGNADIVISVIAITLLCGSLLIPLMTLFESAFESGDLSKTSLELSSSESMQIVLNVVVTAGSGISLLLLNWATS